MKAIHVLHRGHVKRTGVKFLERLRTEEEKVKTHGICNKFGDLVDGPILDIHL